MEWPSSGVPHSLSAGVVAILRQLVIHTFGLLLWVMRRVCGLVKRAYPLIVTLCWAIDTARWFTDTVRRPNGLLRLEDRKNVVELFTKVVGVTTALVEFYQWLLDSC